MMMRKFVAVVLLTAVTGAFAEDGQHAGRPEAPATSVAKTTGAPRPEGSNQLREKPELEFLVKAFPHLGLTYLRTTYSDSLPKAIAEAKGPKKDETDAAKIMAQLYTTIDKGQRDAIVTLVEAERKKALGQETKDERYIDILNRLYWAGKALQGVLVKEPEAQAFLKKFVGENLDFKSGEFTDAQKAKEKISDAFNKALQGGETGKQAKEFLRKELNRDAFMTFIDHNLKAGNTALASKMADAVSWDINGQKFIDMIGPNGEQQRLFGGASGTTLANAISTFSKAKGGFLQTQLAQQPFAKPEKEFFINEKGELGERAVQAAPQDKSKETPPGAVAKFDAGKAKEFLTANCLSCHSNMKLTGSSKDDLIAKGGRPVSLSKALEAVNAGVGGMNLSDTVKKQLRDFANAAI